MYLLPVLLLFGCRNFNYRLKCISLQYNFFSAADISTIGSSGSPCSTTLFYQHFVLNHFKYIYNVDAILPCITVNCICVLVLLCSLYDYQYYTILWQLHVNGHLLTILDKSMFQWTNGQIFGNRSKFS